MTTITSSRIFGFLFHSNPMLSTAQKILEDTTITKKVFEIQLKKIAYMKSTVAAMMLS